MLPPLLSVCCVLGILSTAIGPNLLFSNIFVITFFLDYRVAVCVQFGHKVALQLLEVNPSSGINLHHISLLNFYVLKKISNQI